MNTSEWEKVVSKESQKKKEWFVQCYKKCWKKGFSRNKEYYQKVKYSQRIKTFQQVFVFGVYDIIVNIPFFKFSVLEEGALIQDHKRWMGHEKTNAIDLIKFAGEIC